MKVYIIGIGPGDRSLLTGQAAGLIEQSGCIIGAQRMLDLFGTSAKPMLASTCAHEIAAYLKEHSAFASAAVLVSGDVGFYSLAKRLQETLDGHDVERVCGLSSLQYFAAKLNIPWDDAKIISLHGRNGNLLASAAHNRRTFVLTGGDVRANDVCAALVSAGLGSLNVAVGENLSYPAERILTGTAEELCAEQFESLSVMFIENSRPSAWMPGIDDAQFIRGNVPMTKSEVRAVILSKLRPSRYETVYDIGAGTGSVSVELALAVNEETVYAIERNEEAIGLIHTNKEKFGAQNLQVISGEAPDALLELPAPDCAFIGGCGGRLRETLEILLDKNPNVRIVISAITIETLTQAMMYISSLGFTGVDVLQIGISKSRSAGNSHMMIANNPITLICAQGSGSL